MQMDKFYDFLQNIFDEINITSKYQFTLVRENLRNSILPLCNKQNLQIYFPIHTLPFIIISNLSNRIIKSSFYLQYILAENGFYKESLPLLNKTIDLIEDNLYEKDNNVSFDDVMFQSLYLLFHEFGHCILNIDDNLKESYTNHIKSIIPDYSNEGTNKLIIEKQKTIIPDWLRVTFNISDLDINESIMQSYNRAEYLFSNQSNFEELACDVYSVMTLFPILEELKVIDMSNIAHLSNNLFRFMNDMGTYLYYSNYVFKDSRIPNVITPITGMRIMVIYDAIHRIISAHYPKFLNSFENLNGTRKVDIDDLLFDSENMYDVKQILNEGSNLFYSESEKVEYNNRLLYLYGLMI